MGWAERTVGRFKEHMEENNPEGAALIDWDQTYVDMLALEIQGYAPGEDGVTLLVPEPDGSADA